ncbi:MAG: heme o synthase [Gammaproteobacteria bacterium]
MPNSKSAQPLSNTEEVSCKPYANWRDYLTLCKPRVVALMLLTALVGMAMASPSAIPLTRLILATLGIGLAAGSAAIINHLVDRHIDAIMHRTQRRPLVSGKISPAKAIIFAIALGTLGMVVLILGVNQLTAILTFITLIGYAFIYTVFLKHATPQNIVIGGLAGAAPPLLGWTAITNQIDPNSLLLVLIIFVWTPPHFWALAIYRHQEYAKAGIPMLPVTHGIRFTKLCIVLYTVLLLTSTCLPFVFGMSGWIYFLSSLVLGLRFLYWSIALMLSRDDIIAMKTFRYSITYLMLLFGALLIDHYWQAWH